MIKKLINYGFKVYSQADEDGIINEILNRISNTSKLLLNLEFKRARNVILYIYQIG